MKIKIAVLDWDGVLYDSTEAYVAIFNTVLGLYGRPQITLEDFRESISGPTAAETFKRCGLDKNDITCAVKLFLPLTRGGKRPMIFRDVHDTLRWLCDRHIKIFIASARPEKEIRRLLKLYDLEEFVTRVHGNANPQVKASFIRTLIIDNNISPDELIFVDDSVDVIRAVRFINCYVVASARGFCSYERLDAANPHKIIRNLKNLQGFINLIDEGERPRPQASSTSKKQSEK